MGIGAVNLVGRFRKLLKDIVVILKEVATLKQNPLIHLVSIIHLMHLKNRFGVTEQNHITLLFEAFIKVTLITF